MPICLRFELIRKIQIVIFCLSGAALASGAGIIHRGTRGSGGFIGVKLFTYDYTRHVNADPPRPYEEDIPSATEYEPIIN